MTTRLHTKRAATTFTRRRYPWHWYFHQPRAAGACVQYRLGARYICTTPQWYQYSKSNPQNHHHGRCPPLGSVTGYPLASPGSTRRNPAAMQTFPLHSSKVPFRGSRAPLEHHLNLVLQAARRTNCRRHSMPSANPADPRVTLIYQAAHTHASGPGPFVAYRTNVTQIMLQGTDAATHNLREHGHGHGKEHKLVAGKRTTERQSDAPATHYNRWTIHAEAQC